MTIKMERVYEQQQQQQQQHLFLQLVSKTTEVSQYQNVKPCWTARHDVGGSGDNWNSSDIPS